MTKAPRGLGRGLGELFQNTADDQAIRVGDLAANALMSGAAPSATLADGSYFAELPVASIQPNAHQPRTVFDEDALAELAASIQEFGLLQPVVVRKNGDGYELIVGERRWRAHQLAGIDSIRAIVRGTDDGDMLRDALLENLHRADLNPLEEAAAYQQLLTDFACTQEELAERIKRSRPQISNTIRLLRLPLSVQRKVAAGVLSAGHAKALLTLEDQAAIESLADRIVREGLSVRATEEIVLLEKPRARKVQRPRTTHVPVHFETAVTELSDRLDTRVQISVGKNRGRLTIEFADQQDFDRILGLLAH